MSHGHIEITGARENNLKDVSLRIPKRQITVFTGVSGSGKSSLVFDTIAAEAQRQLNETFTTFVRNRLPRYGQPNVDTIENLSAAIVVDQRRLRGGTRSTVGTITDIYALLRLLFSRAGTPFVGYSNAFSFNDPQGMCPNCEGLGRTRELDLESFLDRSKSLATGALLHPHFNVGSWYWKIYAESGLFDNDRKLEDYSEQEWHMLLHGSGTKVPLTWQGGTINSSYEGLVVKFTRLYLKKDEAEMSEANREIRDRFTHSTTCSLCGGARLNQAALGCTVHGHTINQLAAMEATELRRALAAIDDPVAAPVVATLLERLDDLITIGLGYLSLDRETSTLSGGEAQRVKMVRHLASSLTDMLYVFDEPSVGLHARDVQRLNTLLRKLRDKGNTVLVVEHDPDVIEIADHVVDLGPHAGTDGGEVVYQGTVPGLAAAPTLTGRHLRQPLRVRDEVRVPTGWMTVRNATMRNLRDLTVRFPCGVLTVVTGVAGSGKSTLVHEGLLGQYPKAVTIDQSPVSTSRRSNTATYTGMLDGIRKLFASANKVSPSLFSSNSKGACENCQGLGVLYTDLAFLEGVTSPCEVCQGRRFGPEVLRHTLRGLSISDVLGLTARQAREFFTARSRAEERIREVLRSIDEVGLGYLTLGQPLSTLSGGECQRLKLANELHRDSAVYVLDEPTTGLHMSDVGRLLEIFERLVEHGNSVVVIEHNLEVIGAADWVIDLGPGGGSDGGRVLFEGTPAELMTAPESATGQFLRRTHGSGEPRRHGDAPGERRD
ncbi:daunorubicin resistance protein DrrC [Wenjunlia vitaminophila]|uniref:UvrABC system protein A n=1 Tax=Wenjunlia vitaminophila TaxID=76728 RepID=A0A0T6LUB7_WENVI|nr:excinuclease ABC subunit UvrA [Wenjunlia vitaminophila]KRV49731.1 daunorubicin resistance protein DrrC [Wenjunlia vitaminophila]